MIAPALDAYVELIALDFDDKPYVFCEKRDPNRCLTSSAWSAYCKAIFKKWSGVACPCVPALSFVAPSALPFAHPPCVRVAVPRCSARRL